MQIDLADRLCKRARIEVHQVAQHKAASLTSTALDLLTFPFDKRKFVLTTKRKAWQRHVSHEILWAASANAGRMIA